MREREREKERERERERREERERERKREREREREREERERKRERGREVGGKVWIRSEISHPQRYLNHKFEDCNEIFFFCKYYFQQT